MSVYFILQIKIQYYYYWFWCYNYSSSVHSGWFPCSSDKPHHFWNTFSFSDPTRCSRLILHFPYPSPGINYFSQESWFLFSDNVLRRQDVGVRCSHACQGSIVSRPAKQTELRNICALTHTPIFLCLYTYWKPWFYMDTWDSKSTPHGIF